MKWLQMYARIIDIRIVFVFNSESVIWSWNP